MESERHAQASNMPLVSDFHAKDQLHVVILRSPVANGTIQSIHIPHLPRGYRSITADDIPGNRQLSILGASVPLLASGRVRYRGEPIALLAGPDPVRLREARELAHISIAEEPASFNFGQFNSSRIAARQEYSHGDVEMAFSIAQEINEHDYRSGALYHATQEPLGAAAWFDYDKLYIRCPTQWPYLVRGQVASALKVKESELVIEAAEPGNHLDSRLWYPAVLAAQVALAAVICGRPAVLTLDRFQDFMYTTLRAPCLVSYRSALDTSGHINALDARVVINCGAYGVLAEEMARRAVGAALGAYQVPNLRIQCFAVRSNQPPMGPLAGLILPQLHFACERLMDDCARIADYDPLQFRQKNLITRNSEISLVRRKKNPPFEPLVEMVCQASDFRRKSASFELVRKRHSDPASQPGRGIGLSFSYQTPGNWLGGHGNTMTVEAELTKEQGLVIRSSSIPGTSGTLDIWRQLAAEQIGLEPAQVHFEPIRTGLLPDAGPSTMSATIQGISALIEEACKSINQKRFREALPIKIRKNLRQKPAAAEAVDGGPADGSSWGAAVVELSIDALTGSPAILGVWLAVRAGRVLSPDKAIHILKTNTALALSQALMEYVPVEDAVIPDEAWQQYHQLRYNNVPPIHIQLAPSDPKAPIGGIGDLPFQLVAPALANALSQAKDTPWLNDCASRMPGGGAW